MATRTRLSPQDRRSQLLNLGAELFAQHPYEDVHIERVAELAEVSRGLLYHYFPTKRAFFAALVERSSAQMMAATAPDPALAPLQQLVKGIDAYLLHCGANAHATRAVYRGAASADPEVLAVIARGTDVQVERILGVLEPDRAPHPLLVIAVRSWIMFLRTACEEWLLRPPARPAITRVEVRNLCVQALVGAVLNLPEPARPARAQELLG